MSRRKANAAGAESRWDLKVGVKSLLAQDATARHAEDKREALDLMSDLADRTGYSISSPGFSSLTDSRGNIAEFNRVLATGYGAAAARVGVSGASNAIGTVLGGVVPRYAPGRDIVLCDAMAHKSAHGGIIVSGRKAGLVGRDIDAATGTPLPIALHSLASWIERHAERIAALFLTSTSYEGFDTNLAPIKALCAEWGILLVTDGAWASPYGLFPGFPSNPIAHADVVILSPHKAGLAPCQTSIVLFSSDRLAELYDEMGEIGFATTSPNQSMLAIAEHRICNGLEGIADWEAGLALARSLRRQISEVHPALKVIEPKDVGAPSGNPTHVLIDCSALGIDGRSWAEALSRDRCIDVELATERSVLMVMGRTPPFTADELSEALRATLFVALREVSYAADVSPSCTGGMPALDCLIDMRTAFLSESECVAIEDAVGRIAASTVYIYPPGRPFLTYGQPVQRAHLKRLRATRSDHAPLVQSPPAPDGMVWVVKSDRDYARIGLPLEIADCTIETWRAEALETDAIARYADFFEEVFVNDPFDHFAYDPTDPLHPVSIGTVIGEHAPARQPYLHLDASRSVILPDHLRRWIDPERCRKITEKRLQSDGVVATLTDKTGQLRGLIHVRADRLGVMFETEEWRDPLLFAAEETTDLLADAETFFEKARYHFDLEPNDQVATVSCMALDPAYRGQPNLLYRMFKAIADVLPERFIGLPILAEVPDDGAARTIDEAINDRLVHGLLENGHSVVYSPSFRSVLRYFEDNGQYFRKAFRNQVARSRRPYTPHPADNRKVTVRSTSDRGRGVFATSRIEKGETIAVFDGERYRAAQATALPPIMVDHAIQVSPDEYVHGANGLAELCNHSCGPNAGIRNLTEIFAARPIDAGEEICWDYRCSEDSTWVLHGCACGHDQCTGTVEGFSSLSRKARQHYVENGMVSEWIIARANDDD
ncbi:MAG: SET domain-containing protein-lysine N-methyltransferase [Pseudomonadota bacterium]